MFTAPAGTTTCFSARATDVAGWTPFAWSAEQCTTVPLDDPAPAPDRLLDDGERRRLLRAGRQPLDLDRQPAHREMRGQTIGVLVTKQPGGATIELRWNGSTKLHDQPHRRRACRSSSCLPSRCSSVQSGTLEIVQTGFGTADIDGAGAYKTS